jgi:hypothetical protein
MALPSLPGGAFLPAPPSQSFMTRRIIYFSPPPSRITGGIKTIFRHVEMLVASGIDAVVAIKDGVRPTWFASTAPLRPIERGSFRRSDILVFPEDQPVLLQRFRRFPLHKVVFCQNAYYAWHGIGRSPDLAADGVRTLLAVSRSVADYLARRFEGMPIATVSCAVDTALFRPAAKRLQVAYAPRKRPTEAGFIRDWVDHRLAHAAPFVKISGMSEAQVAETLGQSAVFLALSRMEALPLMPLEAMASGCIVAGFTGIGAREYASAANGFWCDDDDFPACVEAVVRAVELARGGAADYDAMRAEGARTAAAYSIAAVTERLVAFWRAEMERLR